MESIDIGKVTLEGELRCRALKNFARLHDRIYRPGVAGLAPCCCVGWPGDWEGRTMLALVLGEETLHTKAAYLDKLIEWIYQLMNDEGYRSEPNDKLDLNDINEQMHSAQNWMMRAFMEYYRITGEKKYLDTVKVMLKKLYLPIKDHLIHYPKSASDRQAASDKAVIGHTAGSFREWRLSSDTGCIFMSFDALGQAWSMIDEEPLHSEIGALIDALLNEFRHMDYVRAGLQTHATLTCMRGVMRIYRISHDVSLLETVEKYFENYISYGMTVHYANINNFLGAGHTEPCGIVDSYMLACQLWEETGKRKYLDYSHKIWWNALMRAQRENGGFGCETTGRDGILGVFENFYEAYWCCTMRGAEGLGYPARHALYEDDNSLTLPFFFDFTAELNDGTQVQVRTEYPERGEVSFRVLSGNGKKKKLRFYLPEWAVLPEFRINGEKAESEKDGCFAVIEAALSEGTLFEMSFDLILHAESCRRFWHENEERCTIEYGTLVLGTESDFDGVVKLSELVPDGKGGFDAYGVKFAPFHQDYLMEREIVMKLKRRILFKVET